jgi:hypothetical protein
MTRRSLTFWLILTIPAFAWAVNQGPVTWGASSIFYPDGAVCVGLPNTLDGGWACVDAGFENDGGPHGDAGYDFCLFIDAGFADGGWGTLGGPNDGGFADGGPLDGGWQCANVVDCTDGGFAIYFGDAGYTDAGPGDGGFVCLYTDAGNGYAGACGDGGFLDGGWGTLGTWQDGGLMDGGWICVTNGYTSCTGDGGFIDAGFADGGWLDAGEYDAGPGDGGPLDGGMYDGGWLDAGLVILVKSDPLSAFTSFSTQCGISGPPGVNGSVTVQLQGTDDLYPTSNSNYTPYSPTTSGSVIINDGGSGTYTASGQPPAWTQLYTPTDTLDGGNMCCTYYSQ